MSRSSEIVDDYEIRYKRVDEQIYRIDKPDLNIEIKDENPFKKYDKFCDNLKKQDLSLRTNPAFIFWMNSEDWIKASVDRYSRRPADWGSQSRR